MMDALIKWSTFRGRPTMVQLDIVSQIGSIGAYRKLFYFDAFYHDDKKRVDLGESTRFFLVLVL
ncbi:hypothetical protein GCWU000182_00646 [Abiotrophia defectiva ATCC 49176]|uniref:Uncharacterized protein n=1 Tax=Abiotrophia defectiva ATCC 49176 TaxID=592010 RepID=W1Q3Y1_ABIDE|nr:hypothetical protein GCWU000182_00646 [Abiotrophia defectiva ATCC 49176]